MFSKQILVAALGVFATLSGAVAHDVSFGTCAGNVESVCIFVLALKLLLNYKQITHPSLPCHFSFPVQVSITPCNEEPCTLKYEKSYEIDLAFTSNIDSENPRSNVESSYLGADVLPYPGQSPSACPYISGNCPLVSGQRYELKYTTQITLHVSFIPTFSRSAKIV